MPAKLSQMNTYLNNIKLIDVDFGYSDTLIFHKLNLELYQNHINVIVGKSGTGKSTLLKLLMAQLPTLAGEIKNNNVQDISYLSQVNDFLPWYSVYRNIEIALTIKDKPIELANNLIETFKLNEHKSKFLEHLSGGQIKRFALIRTFALDTKWILLDEPFANLDYFTRNELYLFLKSMQQYQHKSIVLITHDLDEALLLADSLFILTEQGINQVAVNLPSRQADMIYNDEFIKLKKEVSQLL